MEHRPFPPGATKPPQSRFPWPAVALGLALLLLIVIFALTPRTDKAARATFDRSTDPAAQVRLSGVRISPQKINGLANVDVYGEATNTGTRPVTQATVSAVFRDKEGRPLMAQQETLQRFDAKADKNAQPKALSQEPLKPGQTAAFQVSYSQVPGAWDGKPPELQILQVTVQK